MERAIIHLNIADFAVAVERLCDSRLRERPVIVAPPSGGRAFVYDMSDEAFQNGIRKGMPVGRALRLCRDATLVEPHPKRYRQASRLLLRTSLPFSPLVEATDDNGHLFVDVSRCRKLFGRPDDIAWRLRGAVRERLDIEPIWTVATNKLVAKVTSRLVKPHGEYIAGCGEEERILAPCPLVLLPGLEAADLLRLRQFNIARAGELAALTPAQLAIPFGRRAGYLHELARGIDCSPVLPPGRKPPSVETEHRFACGSNDLATVEQALFYLSERAGAKLRRQGFAAGKIAVELFYSDQARCGRQANLQAPSADDLVIFGRARCLLHRIWHRRVRLSCLRLVCHRLAAPPPAQLDLFAARPKEDKRTELLPALDAIRRRFGEKSVRWGMAANV